MTRETASLFLFTKVVLAQLELEKGKAAQAAKAVSKRETPEVNAVYQKNMGRKIGIEKAIKIVGDLLYEVERGEDYPLLM